MSESFPILKHIHIEIRMVTILKKNIKNIFDLQYRPSLFI
jgi:hypothetical protein